MDDSSEETPAIVNTMVQLASWTDGPSGPCIRLRLSDSEDLEAFRGLATATKTKPGALLHLVLFDNDQLQENLESQAEKPKKTSIKGEFGKLATKLRLSHFFNTYEVNQNIGSDNDYMLWSHSERCAVCNDGDYLESGQRVCEFAHVRRSGSRMVNSAGTGWKPAYSGVPLCNKHHRLQHNSGESAAYSEYMRLKNANHEYSEVDLQAAARKFFENRAAENLKKWGWNRLKFMLGFQSWSHMPPYVLLQWCIDNKINLIHLPKEYRAKR